MTDSDPYWLLTYAEASKRTGISVRHLKRLVALGALPVWRPSKHIVRIPYWALIESIAPTGSVTPKPLFALSSPVARILAH